MQPFTFDEIWPVIDGNIDWKEEDIKRDDVLTIMRIQRELADDCDQLVIPLLEDLLQHRGNLQDEHFDRIKALLRKL